MCITGGETKGKRNMGRAPCCSKVGLHKGPWTHREDTLLLQYIQTHGEASHWRSLPKKAGLLRCGKSCRLRWMNYLRPDIKRGNITPDEEDLIIRLHSLLGNRWSLIAGRLPGRTDNEIKNYWNTSLSKKLKSQGIDHPTTYKKISRARPQALEQEVKKRSSKSTKTMVINKNNAKPDDDLHQQEKEKPSVHRPKPYRVSSLSLSLTKTNSFECNMFSVGSSSHGGGEGGLLVTEVFQLPSSSDDVAKDDRSVLDFLSCYDDDHMHDPLAINSSHWEWQSSNNVPAANDDGFLEKIYEEYLELIE